MISIIVSHCDEPYNLQRDLIHSLLTNESFLKIKQNELIIVDDGSIKEFKEMLYDIEADFNTKYQNKVRVISKKVREGVGKSRTDGAKAAANDWLLFCDAHSRIDRMCMDTLIMNLDDDSKGKFICGRYHHKFQELDGNKYKSTVTLGSGASLRFHVHNEKFGVADVMVVERNKHKPHYCGEVMAPIGANYVVDRESFLKVGGAQELKCWGGFEALMALKYAFHPKMKGVECWDGFEIPHINRAMSKPPTSDHVILHNKLIIAWLTLPEEVFGVMNFKISQLVPPDIYEKAMKLFWKSRSEHEGMAKTFRASSIKLDEYCEKWQVCHPITL